MDTSAIWTLREGAGRIAMVLTQHGRYALSARPLVTCVGKSWAWGMDKRHSFNWPRDVCTQCRAGEQCARWPSFHPIVHLDLSCVWSPAWFFLGGGGVAS